MSKSKFLVAAVIVAQTNGRAHEDHIGRQRARVGDLRGSQTLLDLLDFGVVHALVLARGVVLGVLAQISQRSRVSNALNQRTVDDAQLGEQYLKGGLFVGGDEIHGSRNLQRDL